MPVDPYLAPNEGTIEYEYARRNAAGAPSAGGIMQYKNTAMGPGVSPGLPVIGAIANSAGAPPPPPPAQGAPAPAPAPVPVPGPGFVGGAPAPGGGVFGPLLGGAPPIRNRYTGWATATQHVGWDPTTGAPVVTHLTGMNSPYPYVIKGGPAPFGTYSAPLLTMLVAGSQAGPRAIAPVAPKAAPGVGGGGPGTGGPGTGQTQTQASTETTPAAETPAAETPAAEIPAGTPLKALDSAMPTESLPDSTQQSKARPDYIDLGWRLRATARNIGWDDWDTASEADLAKRLANAGYAIADVDQKGAAQVTPADNAINVDAYVEPDRNEFSKGYQNDMERAKAIYTQLRQNGATHEDAMKVAADTVHQVFNNRRLDSQFGMWMRFYGNDAATRADYNAYTSGRNPFGQWQSDEYR